MRKFLEFLKKLSLFKKIVLGLGILLLIFLIFGKKVLFNGKNNIRYQTEIASKGNLVVSISGTGTVLSNNYSKITTSATGVVKKVYVKDGQTVNQGDLIAEIDLDNEGKRQFNQAYANYLSAQNSLQQVKDSLYSAQNDLFTKWQAYFNLAQSDRYMGSDGKPKTEERNNSLEFLKIQNDWYAAEANYKLKEKTIKQAEVSLNNAWLSYQQFSPYIYAPISGTVVGLVLQPGMIISSSANSGSNNFSTQIGYIKTTAKPIIIVNLTEVDIPKIKINDKTTIEFDAIKDKTFTGKVYSIDMSGTNNSGVVNYPVYIVLDDETKEILSNMTATVNIIVNVKNDILIIPNTAIRENDNGEKTVQILKNNKPETIVVQTGISNDENTEIISGLKEGDVVITNIIDQSKQSFNSNTQRSFSSFGGFGGGGNLRIR